MRCFISLHLEKKAEEFLLAIQENFFNQQNLNQQKFLKKIPVQQFHITLAFLGEINKQDLISLETILNKYIGNLHIRTNQARASKLIFLPNFQQPRVIAVKFFLQPKLNNFQKQLIRELKKHKYNLPSRNWLPHISLVRYKGYSKLKKINNFIQPTCFKITDLKIQQSLLKPTGPTYISLKDYPL